MIRFWVEDKTSMDGRPFDIDKHDKAISDKWLDKIRKARDEIYNLVKTDPFTSKTQIEIEFNTKVLAILDELIESEE